MVEETKKRGRGRPTKYKKEFCELATNYCMLGCTNEDLGRFFEVDVTQIEQWNKVHPDFHRALLEGRELGDAKMARSMHHAACGYEHEDTHISNYQGVITETKVIKRYPPNAQAAMFMLKNHQPDKFKDRHELGGDLLTPLATLLSSALKQDSGEESGG